MFVNKSMRSPLSLRKNKTAAYAKGLLVFLNIERILSHKTST